VHLSAPDLLRYTATLTDEDTLLNGGDVTLHLKDLICGGLSYPTGDFKGWRNRRSFIHQHKG